MELALILAVAAVIIFAADAIIVGSETGIKAALAPLGLAVLSGSIAWFFYQVYVK